MEAIISKIELKKFLKKYYFLIELKDFQGNVYIVDKPFCNDEVQFRKIVFGIMAACNQFDLLKLGSDTPIYKDVVGYYSNGLDIIENSEDKWFSYNNKEGIYFCDNSSRRVKNLFKQATDRKIPNVSVDKGKIEAIISGSGVFQIFFNTSGIGTFMNTGQIYYGFGYPIYIGDTNNSENVKVASLAFYTFIINIMKFYGVNDLLELSGKVDRYPVVDITVDKKKVTSITNLETGMGILIKNGYEIINVFEKDYKKTLN